MSLAWKDFQRSTECPPGLMHARHPGWDAETEAAWKARVAEGTRGLRILKVDTFTSTHWANGERIRVYYDAPDPPATQEQRDETGT